MQSGLLLSYARAHVRMCQSLGGLIQLQIGSADLAFQILEIEIVPSRIGAACSQLIEDSLGVRIEFLCVARLPLRQRDVSHPYRGQRDLLLGLGNVRKARKG